MTFQINKRTPGWALPAALAAIAMICAPALAAMVGIDCEVSAPFSVSSCPTITGVGCGESPGFSVDPCSPETGVAFGVSEAVSICHLAAEVTGDCYVNVLDMIAVRNHMYEDVATGDNWQYDLTGDGAIDILDMIAVRNELFTMCPE